MKHHSRATIPAQRSVEQIKAALDEVRELRRHAVRGSADRASLDWSMDRLLEELADARRA